MSKIKKYGRNIKCPEKTIKNRHYKPRRIYLNNKHFSKKIRNQVDRKYSFKINANVSTPSASLHLTYYHSKIGDKEKAIKKQSR